MDYKIPEKVFRDFEHIAGRNYSTKKHQHIETLAYLIGEEDSPNEIVVTELVYPDQNGEYDNVTTTGIKGNLFIKMRSHACR